MAKTLSIARLSPDRKSRTERPNAAPAPRVTPELSSRLLWIIISRAALLLLGLNIAEPLGILPERLGSFPFAPFFNNLIISLSLIYLALWWSRKYLKPQLYFQIGADLILATVLVAHTRAIESPFVSFFLLIIAYSSLTLGRNGGIVGASLCTILYAAVITADNLNLLIPGSTRMEAIALAFRTSIHTLGFLAVAFLGSYLSQRLQAVQRELEEKTDSLERLQSLNEHIVSSIRSGLITTDLEGHIALFNRVAAELTERESGKMLEQPVQSIIGKEFWARITQTDLFRDAHPLRNEAWFALPSGMRRFLGFSVSPLVDQDKQLLGYVFSFQDLTEVKRLEAEVRLKDRMAAVGQMAAGIAHEIRNPLTSIRGSVEVLRSRLNLSKTEERLLEITVRESDRLNKFVEDFLLFARPSKYEHNTVDLVPLLHDAATLLRNNPEVRDKYQLALDLEADKILIMGNADQLRQVFWNLAQNAIRAMPTGGTLTIRARKVEDGGAEIVFHDTGVGMSPEEKEQLFQPFHSGFLGGVGLGLSIIFQIMQDHRGSISVESEKGQGSIVTLHLPTGSPPNLQD